MFPFSLYFLLFYCFFVSIGARSSVLAQENESTPSPALQLLHSTEQHQDGTSFTYHALWVDLDHPAFQGFLANTPFESGGVVSDFALKHDLAAAWNANSFASPSQPCGIMQGDGVRWLRAYDEENCNGAVGFANGPQPKVLFFFQPSAVDGLIFPWMHHIVAGGPGFIVDDGIPIANIRCDSLGSLQPCVRHPRLAMGLDHTGRSLLVVTVDGSPTSTGASLEEIARLSAKLGAQRAINLCGGSRATLYVRDAGGVVNQPTGGQENEVCCKLGLRIDPSWIPPAPPLNTDTTSNTDTSSPDTNTSSPDTNTSLPDTQSPTNTTNSAPLTSQGDNTPPTPLPETTNHTDAPASCQSNTTRPSSAFPSLLSILLIYLIIYTVRKHQV